MRTGQCELILYELLKENRTSRDALSGLAAATAKADRRRVLQGYCRTRRYGIWTRRAKTRFLGRRISTVSTARHFRLSFRGFWRRRPHSRIFCGPLAGKIAAGFFAFTGRWERPGVLAAPFMSANGSPSMVAVNKENIGCEKVLSGFFA